MQVLQKQAQQVLTRWLLRSPCNFLQIPEIVYILPCLPCLKYQQLEVHLGLIFLTCLATTANSSLKLRGLYSNSRKCGKWNRWLPPHTWGRAPALGVEVWTRGPRRVENSGLLERKVGSCGLAEYGGTRMWERFIVEAERIPKQLLRFQKLTRYQPGQPVFILKEKGNVFLLPSGDSSRQDFTRNVIDAKQKLVLWPLNPLGP